MGTRLGVRAPYEQRVRAPRVKNGLISCSWLHLLKVWSLLKIRGDSELEAGYRMGAFRINGGLTLTDAEVTSSNNAAYVGKAPNRQAKAIYQLSPTYKFGDTTVGAAVIGTTSSKDAQTVSGLEATLPAYTYVNAFAAHELNKSTTLTLSVNNLTNTLGYTEVNNERSAARSITGRTVKVGVKYNF
ncbi:hypothetical protein B9Z38_06865 [Limnohabitans sp. MMS-10A-160]|uniref:TonB-dependent receptor domain-containing protein n=1 Tax=Limnohabitans sp. MMS-10A-160 TaxID=1835766 RepID=UPI000D3690B7|nr:TonB-dependent receptor [Limnohabitans sp. MMS-10A-160]PUE26151.1 hypothetical protein B9Z38_06865 [Limnohabitans sp. MMS-10A-160]